MIEAHALRFAGKRGAEFDDLVQEGLLSVWEHLQRGARPSNQAVQNAMRDWSRKTARLGMSVTETRRHA